MNDTQRLACAIGRLAAKASGTPMAGPGRRDASRDPLLARLAAVIEPPSPHDIAALVVRNGYRYTVRASAGGSAHEADSLAAALTVARRIAAGSPILVRNVTGPDLAATGATWCTAGIVGNGAFLTL